jgi:hypothetical protein
MLARSRALPKSGPVTDLSPVSAQAQNSGKESADPTRNLVLPQFASKEELRCED